MTLSEKGYHKWLLDNFPPQLVSDLLSTYSVNHSKPFWAAAEALTDYVFKCPTSRAARYLTRTSGGPQIFEYNFELDPVGPTPRPTQYGYKGPIKGSPCSPGSQGVAINYDAMFFMSAPRFLATGYEKDTSSQLLTYLRNFAWSGNPNIFPPRAKNTTLTVWPEHRNKTHQKLWIGPPSQGNITVKQDTKGLNCILWNAYLLDGEPLPGGEPLSSVDGLGEQLVI